MQTAENGYLCLDKKAVLGCERSGLGLETEKRNTRKHVKSWMWVACMELSIIFKLGTPCLD